MTTIELRTQVIEAKQRFGRGEISVDDLYAAADAYIAALKTYKKATGKKLSIPSRAYLIRAL